MQQPLKLKQGLFTHREGLILRQQRQGRFHYGEVSPFPGLQKETLKDCADQLQRLSENPPLFPAVAWGLHQLKHTPVFLPQQKLNLNALLTGLDDTTFFERAEARYAEGYRCFKIKVGLQSIKQDKARLQQLLQLYPDIRLRLDANRGLKLDEFLRLQQAIPEAQLEYFEEPFATPEQYAQLSEAHWKLIALDESLFQGDTNLLSKARAFVLKPMVLGPERLFFLLDIARKNRIIPVISSCFESSLGLGYLASIAHTYAPEVSCGLDTWRGFSEDIWEPVLQAQQAVFDFDHVFFTASRLHQLKWNTQSIRKLDYVK